MNGEIALLEEENQRLRSDNQGLRRQMQKLDKIVYGH